jgi:predicted TIM-barrel fold metal-dependent hydrolase
MTGPGTSGPVDVLCSANWQTLDEYFAYLDDSWRDYFGGGQTSEAVGLKPANPVPGRYVPNPLGEYADDGAASLAEHLDANGIVRALVWHDRAFPLPSVANPTVSLELTRAANDWLVDHVARDDRLYAAILAPTQVPEVGAGEIRRLARQERVAAVVLSVNSLAKPFGHPIYLPLFRAAAESGLPVVIASGSEAVTDSLAYPTAGGLPATYTDFTTLASQSLQTHLVSLVGQGVFEELPDLRVLFAGAGIAWLPPILFRFEANFKALRRGAPWLRRTPAEYVAEHVRFATWPVDRPATPEQLEAFVRPFEAFPELLCYGSGYPRREAESVDAVRELLPEAWHANVLRSTAAGLFRWPRVDDAAPAQPAGR